MNHTTIVGRSSQLLVSVRSPAEAAAALAGGADLIDVKEPDRGPLGRADDRTIEEVIEAIGGRRPVSAALGELRDAAPLPHAAIRRHLRFCKWGLAGCRGKAWRKRLCAAARELRDSNGPHLVAVAYADWQYCDAPPLMEVLEAAATFSAAAVLIDTFTKQPGLSLLDWLTVGEIRMIREWTSKRSIRLAVAGSLTSSKIERLRDVRPDWFAVRGAACQGGREGNIDEHRVQALLRLLIEGNSSLACSPTKR